MKSVLNYKKPAFWITIIVIVVCAVIAVCFLTDHSGKYQARIAIPAESTETFCDLDEEISLKDNILTIANSDGLGDTELVVPEPYLSVYMISEKYGEIVENIPLTEEEASGILLEDKRKLANGYGFSASLKVNGESEYYSENGVSQTVLDLAIEKCGYQFANPDSITAPIITASLDCSWIEKPFYLDENYLSRLEEILKRAKLTGVGNCGYGAKLTLVLENGEILTVFKGTDDCGSLVFGSYGGYSISDEADDEFWEMFGLSSNAEERLNFGDKQEEESNSNPL